MNADRLTTLSAAFRGVPLTCGPHTLRPITAGSVLLLMDTRNALFTEGGEDTESGVFQGLFEFIHIHTAPEEEVIADCDAPAVLRAKARKLALGIGFEDLAAFQQQFEGLRTRLNASLVDIIPEKGEGAGKPLVAMPAPTGSPHSSTPSADVVTQPGSTGSSGVSLSTVPSFTSTPPTPQTEPAPVGRSRIWEEIIEREADYAHPLPDQILP